MRACCWAVLKIKIKAKPDSFLYADFMNMILRLRMAGEQ
jgi:hypothetical protein